MAKEFSPADLEAYLDESLSVEACARVESALRSDPALARQLATILGRRDAGVHSLGEIWRKRGLTCPTRQQLGNFLLGVLDDAETERLKFHLEVIGCRACQANKEDLGRQQVATDGSGVEQRRRKYFESSAGHLRKRS